MRLSQNDDTAAVTIASLYLVLMALGVAAGVVGAVGATGPILPGEPAGTARPLFFVRLAATVAVLLVWPLMGPTASSERSTAVRRTSPLTLTLGSMTRIFSESTRLAVP